MYKCCQSHSVLALQTLTDVCIRQNYHQDFLCHTWLEFGCVEICSEEKQQLSANSSDSHVRVVHKIMLSETQLPCRAHGLSANKLLGLAPYAEAYADLGYASIVFDYRRWGTSGASCTLFRSDRMLNFSPRWSADGVPRNLINIKEQLEDYRMVIKFARLQPEFDGNRVILFGTSFSGL